MLSGWIEEVCLSNLCYKTPGPYYSHKHGLSCLSPCRKANRLLFPNPANEPHTVFPVLEILLQESQRKLMRTKQKYFWRSVTWNKLYNQLIIHVNSKHLHSALATSWVLLLALWFLSALRSHYLYRPRKQTMYSHVMGGSFDRNKTRW